MIKNYILTATVASVVTILVFGVPLLGGKKGCTGECFY